MRPTNHHSPTITVGIPCVPRDLGALEKCILSIEQQTLKPKEIVVSLSSYKGKELTALNAITTIPLKLIITESPKTAGANRNIVAVNATSEYISFIDADDLMHRDRIRIIHQRLKQTNPSALWHGYKKHFISRYLKRRIHSNSTYQKNATIKQIYLNQFKSTEAILNKKGSAPKHLKTKKHHWVCFGHPTIRRQTLLQTPMNESLSVGEDVEYMYRLLWLVGANIIFEQSPLSFYFPSKRINHRICTRRKQKAYRYLEQIASQ